ncbi:MAG TPA: indolepyruvate oxidoreductase subunit beta family protein, partial [Burkholderiaceae bacterium]|nr:indolepyruvate oxidoreductase subunit beta family protein [Burkholderiaceae bacterium]
MSHDRPLAILICALGGEGGGVLAEWLVETAITAGHSVQSTSIPGVAQRTGATTYYVEVFPQPDAVLEGRRPVFSLTPVPGALDLLASSELLETARQVAAGFASRERTQVITSTARALTTAEKMVPGDGRADRDALLQLVRTHSTSLHGVDMTAIAQRSGTVISAVLFGAIAASGVLPFPVEAYWRTIRGSGKGVEASLRGFDAAYEAVLRSRGMPATRDAGAGIAASAASGIGADADARSALDHAAAAAWKADFPVETHAVLALGCARVREYQDARYAQLYLARVARALAAERAGDPTGAHGYATTRETARHLALWMAFDDIVRVAELKCRAARFERVRGEVRAGAGELLRVHDHFKPGVPEFAALLPAGAAAVLLRWEQRRIARGRAPFAWALQLPSHTVIGMLALRGLAALKGLRRRGSRYATEQALIERWLAAVERGAREDAALGRELAECGRLIKGYGATRERG